MDAWTWKAAPALLLIIYLLSPQSLIIAEASSVLFLDSPNQYLRRPFDPEALSETDALSLPEVAAALSVLVGSAPPSTISVASSLKLNKLLMPDPFDRPNAVFALEVTGSEDSELVVNLENSPVNALRSKLMVGETNAEVQLDDEVTVISLDNLQTFDSDNGFSEDELGDFASSFGGSYLSNSLPLSGKLSIPLARDTHLRLDLTKKEDKEFISSLISLLHKIRRVMELHQDLAGKGQNYPEMITGTFDGVKALQENYGRDVAQLGLQLSIASISKMFDSLQEVYEGHIVGVIVHSGKASPESRKLLSVRVASHPSPRWLEETELSSNSTAVAEAVFVRRAIAWTTGLMIIIATLLGLYFLFNMPLTRDTLLYSNVKLD